MHPQAHASLASRLVPSLKAGKTGLKLAKAFIAEDCPALAPLVSEFPAIEALLAGLAEGSPYLWRLCRRFSDPLPAFFTQSPEETFAALLAETLAAGQAPEQGIAMRALRRAKGKMALLIALCDLGGLYDMVRTTEAITAFADACVAAALDFALREAERAGKITLHADKEARDHHGLFVLALGKHGARELNYSSDIDLSIFYAPEALGAVATGDPQALAITLVKTIVKLLNEPTGDGYVQRVDLRLRPDPGMTPIAMPVDAALGYYESVGQNWERAAMIKARVVAGDAQAGAAFLHELVPFIWRKYFDYAAIADIHAMKRQIYAVKGHAEVAILGHDLKIGRGGIREIEFFVQTQQLVYGGRRPVLRGARTLDMLQALCDEGWVAQDAVHELSEAYRFLRTLEHRVQMTNDEQTQKLPRAPEDFAVLAGFAGLTPKGLEKALLTTFRTVETYYARLFETVPGLASTAGSLVFTGVEDDPETLETLKRLGFRRPDLIAETIRGWHFGRRAAITSVRAREILTDLVPGLLEAFGNASDPDGALLAFDTALVRMPAAVELLSILKNNASLRVLFAEILGTAPRLSEIVARHPHVLDVLIDPDFTRGTRLEATRARILPRLALERDYETFLERARELARAERFLLGTRVLSRVLSLDEAGEAHTGIADTFVEATFARTYGEFARTFGTVPGAEVVLLAYGKAGAREMTATSDLDLVVLYDAPPDALSDGGRSLYASEYFARLTQRLVTALSAPMRTGTLYEIDLRLRPSGRKGTVATTLAAFTDYQSTEAEPWEHMALSRARIIAGDAPLATRVMQVQREIVMRLRAQAALRQQVAEMRALMAQSKPGKTLFDVKDHPGGLVDCEFIAQTLVLAKAAEYPDLVGLTTRQALKRVALIGFSAAESEALCAAFALQSGVQQALRLTLSGEFIPGEASDVFKNRLAALLNAPDFAFLVADLKAHQKTVRRLFESHIGKIV